MSKCSKCQNDFIPLLKSDGLPYKTCDRCKCTDKKYRDKHQDYLNNEDKIKKYREVNKDKIKERVKEYREVNKDKINAKNSERITCECGCTSRKDKISQHKKSSCHQKLMEEKNKLKRDLTDEELDVFFRTNYPFQVPLPARLRKLAEHAQAFALVEPCGDVECAVQAVQEALSRVGL
jgi:hypothetical protein